MSRRGSRNRDPFTLADQFCGLLVSQTCNRLERLVNILEVESHKVLGRPFGLPAVVEGETTHVHDGEGRVGLGTEAQV